MFEEKLIKKGKVFVQDKQSWIMNSSEDEMYDRHAFAGSLHRRSWQNSGLYKTTSVDHDSFPENDCT